MRRVILVYAFQMKERYNNSSERTNKPNKQKKKKKKKKKKKVYFMLYKLDEYGQYGRHYTARRRTEVDRLCWRF